jgi:hypothetical protein
MATRIDEHQVKRLDFATHLWAESDVQRPISASPDKAAI